MTDGVRSGFTDAGLRRQRADGYVPPVWPPQPRVLLDPAGHPFCLVRDEG